VSDETGTILRNAHLKFSSPQFVAEQVDFVLRLLGYTPIQPLELGHNHARVAVPPGVHTQDFFISMLTGGWITIYNDDFYLMEEITRRLTGSLSTRGFYLWAEAGASWGYTYYLNGELQDEFCSAIEELYESLFDSPPTMEERERLSGNPKALLADFNVRTVSPEYVAKLFRVDRAYAKGCMVKFAQLFGIETAGRTFSTVAALPDDEKYGRERFSLLRYVEGPSEEQAPDGTAPADTTEVIAVVDDE